MKATTRQYEYLKTLKGGPKTTEEISKIVKVEVHTTWKMLNRLRDKKLVRRNGEGKNTRYALCVDLDSLEITKYEYRNGGRKITDEEKAFARELRENGLVGLRLVDKYHERYPDRSRAGIEHVIAVVRREGCR